MVAVFQALLRQSADQGKNKRKFLLLFGLSLCAVLLFYGITLQNGFVHDDIGQIVQNEHV